MKIDLAQMVRRVGRTRRKRITAPPILPPSALGVALRTVFMRVVRGWSAEIHQRGVMATYARTLGERGVRRDSVDDVRGDMAGVEAALTRLVLELNANLEDWAVRVEEWHRGRFAQLFSATGVRLDTLLSRADVAVTLEAVLAENTALIRSLNDQMRTNISGAVFRGLTNRATAAEVAREIRKQTAIGGRRAILIASDQLQKLTARLDQERQEQVGLEKFEWAHSGKKNPRPEHKARNGLVYRWDSVVARTDPPGRKIRCGCRARAVLELDEKAA